MIKESKWKLAKLKEVTSLVSGKTPSKWMPGYYTGEDGIPWVKIENLTRRRVYETREQLTESGSREGFMVPADAVLLSTNGTVGKVAIAGRPLQTNQQITAIICHEDSGILPEYLYYYLKFSRESLCNMAYVTIANRINRETLQQFILPIAPLSTQKEWITVLECVEDYLWSKEEMLEVVDEYENCWKDTPDVFRFPEKTTLIPKLRKLTEDMKATAQNLLDTLLYYMFGEIETEKNLYYANEKREVVFSGQLGRLVPGARKLLQELSPFQQALYQKFYETDRELAVHEIMKQMKQEDASFGDRDIQSAVATVETLHQIGLLKGEDKKLLYAPNQEPEEENIVRDSEGHDLGIRMWSCIFPEEES